jgi:hypothetical protein
MGTRRYTKARQLLGGDAPVSGYDQLVPSMLARCTHGTKCSPNYAPQIAIAGASAV